MNESFNEQQELEELQRLDEDLKEDKKEEDGFFLTEVTVPPMVSKSKMFDQVLLFLSSLC